MNIVDMGLLAMAFAGGMWLSAVAVEDRRNWKYYLGLAAAACVGCTALRIGESLFGLAVLVIAPVMALRAKGYERYVEEDEEESGGTLEFEETFELDEEMFRRCQEPVVNAKTETSVIVHSGVSERVLSYIVSRVRADENVAGVVIMEQGIRICLCTGESEVRRYAEFCDFATPGDLNYIEIKTGPGRMMLALFAEQKLREAGCVIVQEPARAADGIGIGVSRCEQANAGQEIEAKM